MFVTAAWVKSHCRISSEHSNGTTFCSLESFRAAVNLDGNRVRRTCPEAYGAKTSGRCVGAAAKTTDIERIKEARRSRKKTCSLSSRSRIIGRLGREIDLPYFRRGCLPEIVGLRRLVRFGDSSLTVNRTLTRIWRGERKKTDAATESAKHRSRRLPVPVGLRTYNARTTPVKSISTRSYSNYIAAYRRRSKF